MTKVCLDISTICPVKCRYCLYQYKNLLNRNFMSRDTFDKIVSILVAEKIRYVYLYLSGEPTIHPDFWYMVSKLSSHGIFTNIASKLPVTISQIDALQAIDKLSGGVHFDITIDSNTQATQDKMMYGHMDMDIVWRNLFFLSSFVKRKKISVSVITVVSNHNKDELQSIKQRVKKAGLPWCAKPMGFYVGSMVDDKDINNIADMIGNGNSRFTISKGKIVPKKKRCVGFLKPVIGYDGSVTICCHDFMYKNSVGNILETNSLINIISSKKYQDAVLAGSYMKLPICEGCN